MIGIHNSKAVPTAALCALNDRSACATVTGNVQQMRSATQQFVNKDVSASLW